MAVWDCLQLAPGWSTMRGPLTSSSSEPSQVLNPVRVRKPGTMEAAPANAPGAGAAFAAGGPLRIWAGPRPGGSMAACLEAWRSAVEHARLEWRRENVQRLVRNGLGMCSPTLQTWSQAHCFKPRSEPKRLPTILGLAQNRLSSIPLSFQGMQSKPC